MKRPGAICGSVIVGGNLCGYAGECEHKQPPCKHENRECTYESDDGEFERWRCNDCGERWGVEIAQ